MLVEHTVRHTSESKFPPAKPVAISYSTYFPSSYSYNKTNEIHSFLKFIFGIELYMFRTGLLSIIRSLVLYTQQQV
jgi:hypothetical protein